MTISVSDPPAGLEAANQPSVHRLPEDVISEITSPGSYYHLALKQETDMRTRRIPRLIAVLAVMLPFLFETAAKAQAPSTSLPYDIEGR